VCQLAQTGEGKVCDRLTHCRQIVRR
jgi:hypothetical protein